MPIKTFDDERCRRRAYAAAVRDGIDAPPIAFHKVESLYRGIWEEKNLLASWGDAIPSDADAVSLINETFADEAKPLTLNDVYLHWAEAANGNFIDDRFMFLDHSTLRNIAARSGDGFAFMNSHRTGGLSAPAELPYGRTFAGRYEEAEKDGILYRRALIGIYMLKGVHPNGVLGPSTDDFHAGILGGIFKDVSMGLTGGSRICDVCVRELGDEKCHHVPGTHEGLKPDQVKAQEGRGVSRGMASYTLVDAIPQEVSAVFKGAVPGAAFRKVKLHAKARLYVGQSVAHSDFGSEVLLSYGSLLDGRERLAFGSNKGSKDIVMPRNLLKDLLNHYRDAEAPDPELAELLEVHESDRVDVLPPIRSEDREKLAADKVALAREIEAFERMRKDHVLAAARSEAEVKLSPYVADGRISPAERDTLTNLYVMMASDDLANPAVGADGKPVKRTDLLFSGLSNRKPSGLMTEEVGTEPVVHEDESLLPNGTVTTRDRPTASRVEELLRHTEMGKAGLSDLRR